MASKNLRWSPETIKKVTGKRQRAAQRRWFKNHYGIDVPSDAGGPIMTDAAYEALVKKSCGILQTLGQEVPRPSLRIVDRKTS